MSATRGLPVVQVDAFTDEPFRGNPAAICTLDRARDDAWLQAVAREMNLSETAFIWQPDHRLVLRWFTPSTEVRLCGHATLAAAHVLWETAAVPAESAITFLTLSGRLTAAREDGWIRLDFPSVPAQGVTMPAELRGLIGAPPLWFGVAEGTGLVEVEDEATVRGLAPDVRSLAGIPGLGRLIVTAKASTPGFDFVSRFFAPAVGIDEDPVTGSSHCTLASFWAQRLGRTELVGYQASARGGTVRVRFLGERVHLLGQAVTVMRGRLCTEDPPSR